MANGASVTFYNSRTTGFGNFETNPLNPSLLGTLSSGDKFRAITGALGGTVFGRKFGTESGCLFAFTTITGTGTTITPRPDPVDPPLPPVWPVLFSTDVIYGRDHLNVNLNMIRMDTYAFQIAVVLNGSPVNLAGGTLEYTAKWAVTDPDAAAVIQLSTATSGIVVTDATNGLATITIPSSGTSSLPYRTSILYHDVRFTDSTGAVHTILYGTLTVKPNVSRT